jgi:dethiobiotin synthetase
MATDVSAPQAVQHPALMRSCFVIGTDVGVGKTLVASAIMHLLRGKGVHTVGMKPVAAGATLDRGRWIQAELEQLAAAGSFSLPVRALSPYIFEQALAPHIAADVAGVAILLDEMVDSFDVLATWADVVVVDGVGRGPLAADFDSADLAVALKLPLILVVGIKAGCISRALLTVEALRARGLALTGWVANVVDAGLLEIDNVVASIKSRIDAPLIAQIPCLASPTAAAVAARLSSDAIEAALRQ